MRKYVITIIFILIFSCEKRDGCENYDWIYSVEPITKQTDYTHTLIYNYSDREQLEYDLNSIYFNRYNISIKLVPEGDNLVEIFIIPDKGYRGSYDGFKIEVRLDRVYTSTTAHEIGHSMGLEHLEPSIIEYQNIMRAIESDCGPRFFFNDQQVEKMINYLDN